MPKFTERYQVVGFDQERNGDTYSFIARETATVAGAFALVDGLFLNEEPAAKVQVWALASEDTDDGEQLLCELLPPPDVMAKWSWVRGDMLLAAVEAELGAAYWASEVEAAQ